MNIPESDMIDFNLMNACIIWGGVVARKFSW